MTKVFLENLQKGISKADMKTIAGLWQYMNYAERMDIEIICERKGIALNLHNIKKVLSENKELLKAVYENAADAEKRDLEALAMA
jgi:hypothetical protein